MSDETLLRLLVVAVGGAICGWWAFSPLLALAYRGTAHSEALTCGGLLGE